MWLLRGLSFTGKALESTQANKTQELSAAFTSSYGETLRPHHGILVRPVFAVSYIASLFFFFVAVAPAPRPPEVERREEGREPRIIHIVDLPQAFFSWLIPVVVCLTL